MITTTVWSDGRDPMQVALDDLKAEITRQTELARAVRQMETNALARWLAKVIGEHGR